MKNAKKKIDQTKILTEKIIDSDMSDVLVSAFNRYAKEVITDRAIPDSRDGLKPVQRRIIYGMFESGYLSNKPTTKSATIVGHIMGRYHPHGDSSIYDALVHMSQSWKMEAPLIAFQGNNGSIDDDPAAANRYTEAKLSQLAEYLCMDLDKKTVKMVPTFDDKLLEPTVLPARFPNLLVNGTSGIAVGTSTYIPTHNLAEVIDATIYRINHKRSTLADIMNILPGPDFPTGGIIDDKQALYNLYDTGNGSFYLYAHTYIDEGENCIVIDEIPYGVIKKDFVSNLVKRKATDHLDNISEIIDESAEEYVKICIFVKEGADPNAILNYLQSKGALRNTIACNFMAIDHGHPKRMSLLDMLDSFIDHQRNVSKKAFAFDLKTATDRLEIVEGYIKAYSILSEVIDKIRKCDGKDGVKKMLMNDYKFTERQSEAIAMMPLYRLSNTDIVALKNEHSQLTLKTIPELNSYLNDPVKLDKSIIDTLKDILKKFAAVRKTRIISEKQTFTTVDQTKLIAKENVYVTVTYDGYAKRTSVKSYNSSAKNAGENDPLNYPKIKPGDHLVFNNISDTHQNLLLFTNRGSYAFLPVHLLTDLKWKEEGKHLNNLIKLASDEKIVKCFRIDKFLHGANVCLLTRGNKIKRVELTAFEQTGLTKRPLKAINGLKGKTNDEVVDVVITSGNSDIIVIDELGRCSRFNEAEVPLVSLSAMGVKALAEGLDSAPLVKMLSLNTKESPLIAIISKQGGARLIDSSDIDSTERLGKKTFLIKILKDKKSRYKIICAFKVNKTRGSKLYLPISTKAMACAVDAVNLTPISPNSEMRVNLTSLKGEEIIAYNDFGELITDDFLIEKNTSQKREKIVAKTERNTQLSLFDMFETAKKDK